MSHDQAIYLGKEVLWHALLISSPIALVALLCGLIVSLIQVITQIQDSSFSAVPKVLAVSLMLMWCSNWMMQSLIEFSQNIFQTIPKVIQS